MLIHGVGAMRLCDLVQREGSPCLSKSPKGSKDFSSREQTIWAHRPKPQLAAVTVMNCQETTMNSIQQKAVHITKHRISTSALTLFMAVAFFAGIALTSQAQTQATNFDFANSGGTSGPLGVIAQGRDGNYYGITYFGVVYKVTASGTYTQLAAFTGTDGQNCNGLTLGTDGNFYGTCENGGDNGNSTGTFFKVTPTGAVTVRHYFDGN